MSKLSDLSSDSDVYIVSSDEDSMFHDDSIAKWTNVCNDVLKDHYRVLFLNEQVERLILRGLKEAENSLTKIKEKMNIIVDEEQEKKQNIDSQMKKKKPILTRFTLPYFKINGFHPPVNSDTIELMKYSTLLHPSFKKPWTPDELSNLEENVIENAVKLSIRPLEARINFLSEKYVSNKEKNVSEICELEQEIATIRKDPWAQLAKNKEKLDWLQISADMKEFRDPNECQRMWEYFQNPDINKRNFTEKEDAKLKKIIKEHGARNWENIAKKLKTRRSPFQCFQRYQRCLLERERQRNFFTEKEDELLIKIVEKVRIGNVVNWYKVAHLLGTQKSHRQCSERYKNALRPNVKKGPWFTEDDAMLLLCHAVLGPKWRTICTFLCDRPHYVCIRRYKYALRPLVAAWQQKEEKDKEFSDLDTDSCESQSDSTLKPYKPKRRQWFSTYSKQYTIDEAFAFAKYGIEKVCGKEIDVSGCKKFEDFAHRVKFTDLKEISKILYSEGKELRRNSFRPQMRPVCLDSQELNDSPVQDSNNEENFTVAFVEKQLEDVLKPLIPSVFRLYLNEQLRFKKFPSLVTCLNQIFDVEDDYQRNYRIAPLAKSIENFIIPSSKLPMFPPNFSTMSATMSFFSVLPPVSMCDSVEKSTDVAPTISCGKEYLKSFHNYSKIEENEVQNENESCFPALGNISTSKKVNREWKLFQKRVIATFQWPILLSQLPPTDEQIRLLAHDLGERHRYLRKSKKRKHKSSTDEDC